MGERKKRTLSEEAFFSIFEKITYTNRIYTESENTNRKNNNYSKQYIKTQRK